MSMHRPTLREIEIRVIRAAVRRHGVCVRKAAAELQVSRSKVYQRLREDARRDVLRGDLRRLTGKQP